MLHSRREFLRRAGAATFACGTGAWLSVPRADAPEAVALHASPGSVRLAPSDYPETPIWGYDGRVPGPTIRVRQGERVVRRFVNGLPQPSTVHWHGIRIENAMDGAPELTQPLVPPGEEFLYDFVAPDAGTYWYHPHHRSFEQMARGLYGALVVEESAAPEVDREEELPRELRRPARLGSRGSHRKLDHGQRRERVEPGGVAQRAPASAPRERGERADLLARAEAP